MTNEKKFSVKFEGFPDLPDLPNCDGTAKLTHDEKIEVMLLIGLFKISKIEEGIDNINVFTNEGTQYLKNTEGRQRLMTMLNKTFVIVKNGNIYVPDNPCRILVEDRIKYKYTPRLGHNPAGRTAIFYTAGNDEKFAIEIFSIV